MKSKEKDCRTEEEELIAYTVRKHCVMFVVTLGFYSVLMHPAAEVLKDCPVYCVPPLSHTGQD